MTTNPDAKTPIPELNDQILVDKTTGQIFMKGPVIVLQVPVIVVRHGQTDGNLKQVLQGQADGLRNQLNETGKQQARQTATRLFEELAKQCGRNDLVELATAKKLAVLTSPITRARDSARIFLQFFKDQTGIRLAAEIEPDLGEMSFGRYDGFALEEIDDENFAKLVVRYRTTQDATIDWQGTGESFVDATIRGRRLLETLNTKFDGKIVVAFTHGTFISALRAVLGDNALLRDNGMVAFRDRILEPAELYWLGQSQERIHALLSKLETGKRPMTNSRSKE